MGDEPDSGKIREFFGKHADDYARSESHKKGQDLSILIETLRLTGQEDAVDMATGTGFTAAALAKLVRRVTAVDITPEMLENARKLCVENKLGNVDFVLAEVTGTHLPSESYDLVVTRRAAHHFTDKKGFLMESKRMLRTGGRLAIVDMAVPEGDMTGFFNRLEKLRDHSHVGALKKSEWLDLMDRSHFEVIECRVFEERMSLEQWLYPVTIDSPEGMACSEFFHKLSPEEGKAISLESSPDSMVKRRVMIIARRKYT